MNRPAMRFCDFAHNEESRTKSVCSLARGLMIMVYQRLENRFHYGGRNRASPIGHLENDERPLVFDFQIDPLRRRVHDGIHR